MSGDLLRIVAGGFSSAALRSGMPSIHSVVSTRAAVRCQSTAGTRNSDRRACARQVRTPPRLPCADQVPAPPTSPAFRPPPCRSRRASAENRSAQRAAKAKAERSRANSASTPGRRTFTATARGGSSVVVARCTCAIDAAAIGSSNDANALRAARRAPPDFGFGALASEKAASDPAAMRAPRPFPRR